MLGRESERAQESASDRETSGPGRETLALPGLGQGRSRWGVWGEGPAPPGLAQAGAELLPELRRTYDVDELERRRRPARAVE
jgi:hypothetical protein